MHAVAFLRGINLGGHTIKKGELIEIFESIGLTGVTTFIASGNVIFDKPTGSLTAIETKAEAAFHKHAGYSASTFIRTIADLKKIVANRPFDGQGPETGGTLHVGFLKQKLPAANLKALKALDDDNNSFDAYGKEWFHLTQSPRSSDSGIKPNLIDKALGHDTSMRSIKTVINVVEKWG